MGADALTRASGGSRQMWRWRPQTDVMCPCPSVSPSHALDHPWCGYYTTDNAHLSPRRGETPQLQVRGKCGGGLGLSHDSLDGCQMRAAWRLAPV